MLSLLSSIPQVPVDDFQSDDDEPLPRPSMSNEAMMQLNDMRVNNQLCDASITSDQGVVFNVHRAMMSACSEYFRTLFTTPLNEQRQEHRQETTVVGVSPATMERIIRFAYLRDVSGVDESNVVETMVSADYFGVLGLLKFCIEFIINILSPENCVIFWLMSRYRCTVRLMEKSRFYILEHFVRVAVESKDIVELTVDDFFSIVNDEMLNVKDEQVVWECILRWIDCRPAKRAVHLTRLMRAVRLGLLPNDYFMEHVKRNKYVENDPEARPIIVEAMRFLCDLETISSIKQEMLTPALAIPRLPHEVIFAIGGWSEGAPQTVIESYDTRADRWVRVRHEDPSGPRSYHGTAVIGQKVYCIGGFNGTDYFNTCSRFDAVKKTWREIAPMHIRRCYVSVTTLDGFIYALGGYDGHSRQKTVERYDTKKNQWTMVAQMHLQRSDADACTLDGKIFMTGGFNGHECLNSAEFYSPKTDQWTMLPPMMSRRSGVSCVAHRGLIYVIGGFNGVARMNTGEKYNPKERSWTNIKAMSSQRSNFGLEIIDDMIFAVGGFNGVQTISQCECYVPEADEWLEATDMGIIRSALTANVIHGLPNIRDYIHKERDKLVEERRMKILGIEPSELTPIDSVLEVEIESSFEELEAEDDDDE